MSTPASILTALKTQLEADTTLADTVEVFLLGVRENISEFPAIIIEPVQSVEDDDIRNQQEIFFTVAVMGYVNVKNPDKQLVGDSDTKGILDLENDVKKAISSDPTIGATVANTQITETKYEFTDYPIRSFAMTIVLYHRQNLTTRT